MEQERENRKHDTERGVECIGRERGYGKEVEKKIEESMRRLEYRMMSRLEEIGKSNNRINIDEVEIDRMMRVVRL